MWWRALPHMAEKVADGSLEATVTGFVNVAPRRGSFTAAARW